MATTKKTTTKSAKRPAAKKVAPARSVSRTSVRRVRAPQGKAQSLKPAKDTAPFLSFKLTDQTVYWLILSGLVLLLGLWVISINDKVQRIYDQVDALNAESSQTVVPVKPAAQ